jgi:hypothetical protein
MSGMNGVGPVPDLGAIRAQQQARAAAPAYDPGTPEFTLQIGGPRVNGHVSFTAAMDAAAGLLAADGWEIVEVKQCAHAGDSQPLSSICPRRGVGSAHGRVTAACEALVHMPLTSYDRCENDLEPPSDPTGIARIPASALSGHYLPEL